MERIYHILEELTAIAYADLQAVAIEVKIVKGKNYFMAARPSACGYQVNIHRLMLKREEREIKGCLAHELSRIVKMESISPWRKWLEMALSYLDINTDSQKVSQADKLTIERGLSTINKDLTDRNIFLS